MEKEGEGEGENNCEDVCIKYALKFLESISGGIFFLIQDSVFSHIYIFLDISYVIKHRYLGKYKVDTLGGKYLLLAPYWHYHGHRRSPP